MAAALYFKGDGLVARRAAAQAWGLLDVTQALSDDDEIEVLLSTRSGGCLAGVRVHRTKNLTGKDVRWCNNIPVTSPARTLLDLAAVLGDLELEAAVQIALGRNLVRASQVRDVIVRNPRAKGVGSLRLLMEQGESLHDTRSRYERKLLRLIRQAELPLPRTNVKVAGKLVDAYWPELKLVIEFDGWEYHRGRSNFESDRLRDQLVTSAGHHVVRVTARQIDHSPYALVARIATTIANLRRPPMEIPY
jgi:very-short-patch-repair endonuclease